MTPDRTTQGDDGRDAIEQLAAEISRKISRVHPSHHASTIPVTIKISRTYAEMQSLIAALNTTGGSNDR